MARLLSVNVGLPKDIPWHDKTVHTAVWKHAVPGRHRVRRLNIDGDKQGDTRGHGGEQRAVLVYQIESYRYWEHEFGRSDFVYGQFGENFTVAELPDDQVCVGDRYRIGTALFEVTQPRITCYRIGIRMGEPRMAALLVAHHRPGFYLRVLEEGEVGAGDEIVKVKDGPEHLTVTDADALVFLPGSYPGFLERALGIEAFSPGWKIAFRNMAEERKGIGWTEKKGIIRNSGVAAAWRGFRPLKVTDVHYENAHVLSLTMESDGEAAARAAPGQFITLRLPAEGARSPVLRNYSLTDTSTSGRYPISVKEEPHGIAGAYLRQRIGVGDTIETAAPRGGFILRPGAQPVVLLSAGIGVTPVLAMLRALVGAKTKRRIWWIHSARNSEEHPFAREVDELLRALPDSRRMVAYTHPLPQDRPGAVFDSVGRLNADGLRRLAIPADADVYLCGPNSFMRDLGVSLGSLGIPSQHVRTEFFGPGASYAPGLLKEEERPPHAPSGPAGTGPEVSFARSGLTIRWDDRYASLLELAEAADVRVRWACRTGLCHTCISRLVSGAVSYDPEPIERPSEDNVLICCSRPTANVTLDL